MQEGWLEGSLTEALALASRTERNVLVEYYSPTCTFCRRMESDVFSSGAVREALGDLVHVRMTRGKNAGPFEMRWRNTGTPTFVVLRPDGRQLGPVYIGALKESAFLTLLAWARSGEGPAPALPRGGT